LLIDTTFFEIDLRSVADLLDDTIKHRAHLLVRHGCGNKRDSRMRRRRSELLVSFLPVLYTKLQQGRVLFHWSIRTEPPSQQRLVATAKMRPVNPDV
jgi:hypothetical protein